MFFQSINELHARNAPFSPLELFFDSEMEL
jgi:hypothetical protein